MTKPTQIEAALKMLQLSSCFGKEVCALMPCACAETMVHLTAAAEVGPMNNLIDDPNSASGKRINPAGEVGVKRQNNMEWLQSKVDALPQTDAEKRAAAAEVGESDEWQRGYEAGMKSAEPAIAILKQDVAEMKERCAQVAENYVPKYGADPTPEGIAAAIRALKDKP